MFVIIKLEKRMPMKSCYIHIPFCENICTYCDFCKMYYNPLWVDKYLDALKEEINKYYKGEKLSTIYVGGGTPTCLSEVQLEKLLDIFTIFNREDDFEYTIETNVESLNGEKIQLLKKYGINRVSIGVQSLNEKHIKYLGRRHTKEQLIHLIKDLQNNNIDNINVDLIYAIENQTLEELKEDITTILELGVQHVSTYSLIIEDNTKLGIKKVQPIDEELDFKMFNYIKDTLEKNDFVHYEISNFAKAGYQSRHNLTYWNNEEYYGFGLGASGYIGNIRYTNTRSLNRYFEGTGRLEEAFVSENEKIENEFILGLRKINGINKAEFKNKFNRDILSNDIVNNLLKQRQLVDDGSNIYINIDQIYVSNSILIEFIGGNYGED